MPEPVPFPRPADPADPVTLRGQHPSADEPSPWIRRWLSAPPHAAARLLDLACGGGRHARWAAGLGWRVVAVDRDARALASLEGTGIETRQEDLEGGWWRPDAGRFDAIVCTRYLHRPRLDLVAALLAPGGAWLHETFAVGQALHGRPSNPAFLLRPGELVRVAQRNGLHLVAYEDGCIARPTPARVQRMVAVRPPFVPEHLPLDRPEGVAAALESRLSPDRR